MDGFYSYELGSWHIIVLNSECKDIGGCQAGSREEKWLRADLAAHSAACTLAYWHKPLFSSGGAHGNDAEMRPFWQALYEARATIVVNGHDHDYERFAPQSPDGAADAARGIREFVAGTGGKNHRPFGTIQPNSEARNADAFGLLKLTLREKSYDWQFIPEAGKTFADSGTGTCHYEAWISSFIGQADFFAVNPQPVGPKQFYLSRSKSFQDCIAGSLAYVQSTPAAHAR